MGATRLKRLKAVEVSYVPRGANRKNRFLALKEDDEMAVNTKKIEELIAKMTLKNETAITKALDGLAPEDADALKAALKVLQALGDKVTPATMQEIMGLVDIPSPEDQAAKAAMTDMVAKAAKADAEVLTLKAEVAKLKSAPPAMIEGFPVTKEGDLDVEKVPVELRATIKSLWDGKKERDEKLAKVTKQLDEERDLRVTKDYVEKASAFKHLPIKKEDLGKALKAVALADPEAFKHFETVLKAADAIVAKADPTSETGTNAHGSDGGDFEAQIEAGTQAIMKEKKLDRASAMTHFITSTPEGRKVYSDKRNSDVRAAKN